MRKKEIYVFLNLLYFEVLLHQLSLILTNLIILGFVIKYKFLGSNPEDLGFSDGEKTIACGVSTTVLGLLMYSKVSTPLD